MKQKGDTKFEDYKINGINVANKGEYPLKEFIQKEISEVDNILEAGCGNGGILKVLQTNKRNAEGFDISEEAIELCKHNGVKNVTVSSISDFKSNKKYDCIICFSTLYYLRNFKKDFKKLVSLLKEEGKLIVNFYNPLHKKDKFTSVEFKDFKKEIKNNNLRIEKVIPQSKFTGGIKSKYFCQLNIYILTKK